MANVEHFDALLRMQNAVDHSIDVWIAAVQQMSKLAHLSCNRAAVWLFFQADDGALESPIPFQRRLGIHRIDFPVQVGKVALSAGGDLNEVCHA